jgi:hypothetical protein
MQFDVPLLQLDVFLECSFFKDSQRDNPYDLAFKKAEIDAQPVQKLLRSPIVNQIRELADLLMQQPIVSEKNGRVVRAKNINQGEIVMYCTGESEGATIGNHRSGSGRHSLVMVVKTAKQVLVRSCTSVDDAKIEESHLKSSEAIVIPPTQIHALRLPPNTQILLFSNKGWEAASLSTTRELISYDFDDQELPANVN